MPAVTQEPRSHQSSVSFVTKIQLLGAFPTDPQASVHDVLSGCPALCQALGGAGQGSQAVLQAQLPRVPEPAA